MIHDTCSHQTAIVPIGTPKQSLYQHDVCYRDVIKCPAVQATPSGHLYPSPLSPCDTPTILTPGCHAGFAPRGGAWSYGAAF